jgi:hypothetical protein
MIPTEETGEHSQIRSQTTLPAYPAPGVGALLRVGCLALGMRNSGHPDEVVVRWRTDAKAAIRSPSIPPES